MLKSEEPLSAIFKCLGDPGRRTMLARLSEGEATLRQLAEPLDMSLPAVHQHLALLEHAGLVTCEKRGRERWCRLEPTALTPAQEWLSDRRRMWERRLGGLDEYLAEENPHPKGSTDVSLSAEQPARGDADECHLGRTRHGRRHRVGGVKQIIFGPRGEAPYYEDCRYEDIVTNRRLCSSMTIVLADERITTSMVTVDLLPVAD